MNTFNVNGVSFEKKVADLEDIFDNMETQGHGGLSRTGYMLAGDTGVGKTSFVKDMTILLGLELILIEVPHLVEEHIISIPFIVFSKGKEEKKEINIEKADISQHDFEVQMAKSSLFSQLTNGKKMSDSEYLKKLYSSNEDLIKIFEELGGSKNEIPDLIQSIRSKYNTILFLDEFFRQTSKSIRNMLRGILNGRIGSDEVPKGVYTIYASNLVDEGIGEFIENEDFGFLEFKSPDKEEWFAYLTSKFKKDQKVKFNEAIIDKFYKILESEDLSHDDIEADVRISPRRWEQLLLYINSSIPVKDVEDAKRLLSNVTANFRGYLSGKKADLSKKVLKAVEELIKETSKIDVSANQATAPNNWRDTLQHQIEQKVKLGNHRKYIPIVSGMPGIGKTSHIYQLALKLNMVPVIIDVHLLEAEDVVGVPLSKQNKKNIEVHFSKPPLLQHIESEIKKEEAAHLHNLEDMYGKEEGKKKEAEYKKAEYKYLLFFDELNRTKNVKVFNAIRKVLLEKSFGDGYKLPEGSVIIGAINPEGKGVMKLTKHVQDVLDIIPTGVSWSDFSSHLDKTNFKVNHEESVATVRAALDEFVDRMRVKKSDVADVDPHFFLDVGNPVYISPREYKALFANAVVGYDRKFTQLLKKIKNEEMSTGEAEDELRNLLYRKFKQYLDHAIKNKSGNGESPEFDKDFKEMFNHVKISSFTKSVKTMKLEDILRATFDKKDKNLFDEIEFQNYISHVEPQKFKQDLEDFLRAEIKPEIKEIQKLLDDKSYPKKSIKDEIVEIEKEQIGKIEFVVRELLHAIKYQQLNWNMTEMVREAIRDLSISYSEILQSEEFPTLMMNIRKTIRSL